MSELSQIDLRGDRAFLELWAAMLSLGETLDLPTGYSRVGTRRHWHYPSALPHSGQESSYVTATGSEVVSYEIICSRPLSKPLDLVNEAAYWSFLNPRRHSLRAYLEPIRNVLCLDELIVIHGAGGVALELFIPAHRAGLMHPSGLLYQEVQPILRERWEGGIALHPAPIIPVQTEVSDDEEAFELMTKAEIEEERQAEEVLDDSRMAYTLVRDDE